MAKRIQSRRFFNDHRSQKSGEFHVKLAEAYGNSIILKTVRELVTKTSLIVGMFGSSSHSSCPDDEHQRLLDAIANGG
ncbi:MAG: FCD domain-containing protein, partial [Alphaproteobacteria bacterium]|nr:FCD domain-containing protein [Alphaproteobacteria bacterium]